MLGIPAAMLVVLQIQVLNLLSHFPSQINYLSFVKCKEINFYILFFCQKTENIIVVLFCAVIWFIIQSNGLLLTATWEMYYVSFSFVFSTGIISLTNYNVKAFLVLDKLSE